MSTRTPGGREADTTVLDSANAAANGRIDSGGKCELVDLGELCTLGMYEVAVPVVPKTWVCGWTSSSKDDGGRQMRVWWW